MLLSQKSKNIFGIFFCISRIYQKFGILWRKRWALEVICFWYYILRKAVLVKCRKSLVAEHLWRVNMLKGTKHCINWKDSIWSYFWWLWKKISSKNFVLGLSEILSLSVNILTPGDKYSLSVNASVSRNQFKCYYLKIKKHFVKFFLRFRNFHKIWNTLKRKMSVRVICFGNYRLQKVGLFKCWKRTVSEQLGTVNMLKGRKDCLNLQGTIFAKYFEYSERKSAPNILF